MLFAIGRKPLTLRGKRVRFVSSLTYLGHSKVVDEAMVGISYGSDDVEGRFAALTMRSLLRDLVDVSAHSTTLDGGRGAASEDGEPSPGLQLPFERQREHEALSNSPFAVAAGGGSRRASCSPPPAGSSKPHPAERVESHEC